MSRKQAKRKRGRPPRQLEPRRTEILQAAVGLFGKAGLHETDMQTIADKLGLAKGTLYLYFPSKRELYSQALRFAMASLAEAIEAEGGQHNGPVGKLHGVVLAYLEFFRGNPRLAELILRQRGEAAADARHAYMEAFQAHAHRLESIFQDGIAAGVLRPMSVEQAARVFADLLYGVLFSVTQKGPEDQVDVDPHLVADLMLNGIVREGGII
jgi:TetR/AcrR family fatty acid metabolism transcriptional regulator